MRVAYRGVEDLKRAIPDLSDEEIARSDFGTYTEEQFLDDMGRVTEYRCDPDLTEILVKKSLATVAWMRNKGVRFTAAWGRQAFNIGGRFKFWGGLTVEAVGGGPGPGRVAHRHREEERHRDLVRGAREGTAERRLGRDRGRREAQGQDRSAEGKSGRARGRRLPVGPGAAHALPRPGLGTGQGARHALQHRRRHPHGARAPARPRPATGRAATRWPGSATRRSSATSRSATSSRSIPIPGASTSTPRAGASSTKARTSATTPTPSTAA